MSGATPLRWFGLAAALSTACVGSVRSAEPSTPDAQAAAPASAPAPAAPEPPAPVVAEARAEATVLRLIPRAAWGAKPAKTDGLRPHTIAHLTVHHSASFAGDVAGAAKRVRGYQSFHQSKGFPDIAYHYIIDRGGNIFEGRDVGVAGSTFTAYDPAGHFLALLDGNYEEQAPTSQQLDALAALLAWGSQHFRVSTATIGMHKDYASTACPGKNVEPYVRDGRLRAAVDAVLAKGAVSLVPFTEEEGRRAIAAAAETPKP